MSEYENIEVSPEGRAARLTLARPPLNVLNIAMLTEINSFLATLSDREDLCALVIDGEGKNFCAGVDVPEHTAQTVERMLTTFHETFRLLYRLPVPTVCAVQGGAYGGGMELAMFCDIILAADDLKIGVPEITLGVFPPPAIVHLARLVGVSRAAELIYTGRVIQAEEALRIGLVNRVVPAADLPEAAEKLAGKLAGLSAFSLRQTKKAFQSTVLPDFESRLNGVENRYLKELMAGTDPGEGLAAFMAKRKPAWSDR